MYNGSNHDNKMTSIVVRSYNIIANRSYAPHAMLCNRMLH